MDGQIRVGQNKEQGLGHQCKFLPPDYTLELRCTVPFRNRLSFVSHCKEKINKTYSMLGIIKRNFIDLTEDVNQQN